MKENYRKRFAVITPFGELIKSALKLYPFSRFPGEIKVRSIRDVLGEKGRVDDYAFGGKSGMVLRVEPFHKSIKVLKEEWNDEPFKPLVILLSPSGVTFDQKKASDLAKEKRNVILVSGAYEGIDSRILNFIDYELSVGDYILSNGDISALVVLNTVCRLTILAKETVEKESFGHKFPLGYPVFTRPRRYNGLEVPKILLTGDHGQIEKWRALASLASAVKNRPDLLWRKKGEQKITTIHKSVEIINFICSKLLNDEELFRRFFDDFSF